MIERNRKVALAVLAALFVPAVAFAAPPKGWTNCKIIYRGPCGGSGCPANAQTIRWRCDQGVKDDCEVNTKTCGSTVKVAGHTLAITLDQATKFAPKDVGKNMTAAPRGSKNGAPGDCAYFYGTGDAQTVNVANVCTTPRLFTIHWPGATPDLVKYRVNQGPMDHNLNMMRETQRRAQNGTIVSDDEAHLGVTEPAKVHAAERDLGGGAFAIEAVNDSPSMIYAEWNISIMKGGKVDHTYQGGALIKMGRKIRVGGLYPGLGESKRVDRLQAEKEEP